MIAMRMGTDAMSRGRRKAWILALAALQLLMLLGPLARAHTSHWVEVCTAAGTRRVPATPEHGSARGCEHCPLCRVANDLAGPPALAGAEPLLAPMRRIAQPAAPCPAHKVPLYDAPPARAPPL
jgi:hypothetical protein